jgi:hypothetical protein
VRYQLACFLLRYGTRGGESIQAAISLALLPGARNCPLEQNVVHFCVTQYSHMTATPAVDAALHSETDLDCIY